ncbi:MAG: GGDEF domain-containing protein [Candidatus Sericytochromatia bacterium]|nr:GGDEF domain-containing protein [Candidatus Sericytochromatia bacterium]
MDPTTTSGLAPDRALYHAWLVDGEPEWTLTRVTSSILRADSPGAVLLARRAALSAVERRAQDAPSQPLPEADWLHAIDALAAAALEILRLRARCDLRDADLEAALARLRDAEEEANTDVLTGLANRRNFLEHADRQVAIAQRYGSPLAVLLLDVDHFKACNDLYGHAAGDVVLRQVAATLSAELRHCDLAARYGGEEFTVLCPSTDAQQALQLAERLRQAIEDTILLGGVSGVEVPQGVTVSVGVATAQTGQDAIEQILQRADAALYRAKREGRNRVVSADFGGIPCL